MSTNFALQTASPPPFLESLLDVDQGLLDALPIGIYACDADGLILRVNRKACDLWGGAPRLLDPAQRFCGSFRVESLDGQVIAPQETPMARALLLGESFAGAEAVVENPDGRRWVARVNAQPLRDANGAVIGAINCFEDVTREHRMRDRLERQQRTFDLAMIASKMGTWRYTVADNICLYDENAQKLYGLTDGRFLHDEAGVKDKFHPDDMDHMWARVAAAIDPVTGGRYEVEYRVKQLDGSWRWLSAWGLVEFDGEGPDRKPVAIAGASRDISELKEADALQRLLMNELNHRVKNTLATVQSIASQTLRGATDLTQARQALEARIISLALAHDLLTERSWTGADLRDVVGQALAPFTEGGRFDVAGPSVHVPPRHTLTLSLVLHELATNAAKYGALAVPEGRVTLRWTSDAGRMHLVWHESGGPPVAGPTRRGFGSRLIESGFAGEDGGYARITYAPKGVRCEIGTSLARDPNGLASV